MEVLYLLLFLVSVFILAYLEGYIFNPQKEPKKSYYCERCGSIITMRENRVDKYIMLITPCNKCEKDIEKRVNEEIRQEIIDSISSK